MLLPPHLIMTPLSSALATIKEFSSSAAATYPNFESYIPNYATIKHSSYSTGATSTDLFTSYLYIYIHKSKIVASHIASPTGKYLEVIRKWLMETHPYHLFTLCHSSWLVVVSDFDSYMLMRIFSKHIMGL